MNPTLYMAIVTCVIMAVVSFVVAIATAGANREYNGRIGGMPWVYLAVSALLIYHSYMLTTGIES